MTTKIKTVEEAIAEYLIEWLDEDTSLSLTGRENFDREVIIGDYVYEVVGEYTLNRRYSVLDIKEITAYSISANEDVEIDVDYKAIEDLFFND